MDSTQAKNRIEELRKTLEYHAKKYYDEDKPEISDFEYDMMMNELKNLEKQFPELVSSDSLTQKVGGHVKEGFTEVTHEIPLQSLQDVFSFEELKDFDDRVRKQLSDNGEKLKYVVETKIDGLSMAVEYINGKFVRAATRGNGLIGVNENLTYNVHDFLFSHHITSYENRMDFNKYCLDEYDEEKCKEIKNEVTECLENINIYDYLKDCETPTTESGEKDYFSNYYLKSSWIFPNLKEKQEQMKQNKKNFEEKKLKKRQSCYNDKSIIEYFNRKDVKSALHVNTDINWNLCSSEVNKKYVKQPQGSFWAYPLLINSGIRILIYSGDTDITVPYNANQEWIEQLKLEVVKPWKQWRAYGNKKNISGYYVKYKGFTFCTFKGVGHMVPEFKPKDAFYVFSKFINNEDF